MSPEVSVVQNLEILRVLTVSAVHKPEIVQAHEVPAVFFLENTPLPGTGSICEIFHDKVSFRKASPALGVAFVGLIDAGLTAHSKVAARALGIGLIILSVLLPLALTSAQSFLKHKYSHGTRHEYEYCCIPGTCYTYMYILSFMSKRWKSRSFAYRLGLRPASDRLRSRAFYLHFSRALVAGLVPRPPPGRATLVSPHLAETGRQKGYFFRKKVISSETARFYLFCLYLLPSWR